MPKKIKKKYTTKMVKKGNYYRMGGKILKYLVLFGWMAYKSVERIYNILAYGILFFLFVWMMDIVNDVSFKFSFDWLKYTLFIYRSLSNFFFIRGYSLEENSERKNEEAFRNK